MLKGLKKNPKENNEQKNEQPIQRSQNIPTKRSSQPTLESQLISLNQQAFEMLIAGKEIELKAKLEHIRHKEEQLFSLPKFNVPFGMTEQQEKSSKFDYSIDFEKDEENLQGGRRKRPLPTIRAERTIDYCHFCPENEQLCLLSAANYVYLALPKLKTFRNYSHYIISPVEHQQTRVGLDADIEEEIKNYQKCLIQMFEKMNLHAIFLEQFSSNNSHIYIECLAIPLKKAYDLPFFFKQALESVEGNWTAHKNIIQIRKQKGGITKQIPKPIKYCYIDFGLGYGYAHVIENEKYWDRGFLHEVVAAALGLESYTVKTTEQYLPEELQKKGKEFDKSWKDFDWTTLIKK